MASQVESSLHTAEEHLLRAEAEMAQASKKIVEAAKASGDARLAQLADVVVTHRHLVGHLAGITLTTLSANLPGEHATLRSGQRLRHAV